MIRVYFKSSEDMSEIASESIQLAISGAPQWQSGYLHVNMPESLTSMQVRTLIKHSFPSIQLFQSKNCWTINEIAFLEIERVLKSDGIFILNVGFPTFKGQKDAFISEINTLYPHIVAEDIVYKTNLQLRKAYVSKIRVEFSPNTNILPHLEYWYVFSKTANWKEKQTEMPLILSGFSRIFLLPEQRQRVIAFPERILEMLIERFSDENDELLDAYAGSGTLGIVGDRMKRNVTLYEVYRPMKILLEKRLKHCSSVIFKEIKMVDNI